MIPKNTLKHIKVGYIGVGMMGKPIAANVVQAGYPLMVYDIRKEPLEELSQLGALVAGSCKEVGGYADVVEISVVDDAQVEQVVLGEDGVLEGSRPGSIIVIHSTVEPKTAVKIGELAGQKGIGVVDAPVSGGHAGATSHTLLYMVGGERELFEQVYPIFATSGSTIVHMGPLGTGSMMRIVHHVIFGLHLQAADEGMHLAEKLGLDLVAVTQAMHGGTGQSHVTDYYLEKYRDLPRRGVHKIAGFALRMGYDLGLPLFGSALLQQLYLTKAKARPKGSRVGG